MQKLQLYTTLMLVLTLSYSLRAQTPSWGWTENDGGGASDYAYGTATDTAGNVYYCGTFYSSNAVFESITIVSGGLGDGFLCKYDVDGNFLWVRTITGINTETCAKVAVSQNGDVFVTGTSEGDFSADGISFTSYGEDDAFVAKYSSSGELKWINHYGGAGEDYSYSLAVDDKGRCVVTGRFEDSMTFGNVVLTSQNDSLYDCFVAKFDKKGNLMWATSVGGSTHNSYVYPNDIAIGPDGSIFITGTYTGPVNFGDYTLNAIEEAFIAKLNPKGDFKWAVDAGSRCYYTYIALDASSNIYVSGSFGAYGYPTQIGDIQLTTIGPYMDVYLAKFNSSGVVQNVQTGGSNQNDYSGGVAVDAEGNAWISGYIKGGIATFGSKSFISLGNEEVFVTGYDAAGNVKWLMQAGSTYADHANDLAYDGKGALYVAGSFKMKITFGSTTLNAPSSSADAFLAKISVNGFKFEGSHVTSLQMEVYPNPATDILMINSPEAGSFDAQIFSEDGKMVMRKEFAFTANSSETLDISSLLPGNYILYLTQDGKNSVAKFLKQ